MGREVPQTQQSGALGMGHHPGQGVLQVLGPQGIEVVGIEIVAVGHGHQPRRRAQPRRGRRGAAQDLHSPAAITSRRFSSPQTGQRRR